MRNLLVIANLYHASPRIPALVAPLRKRGWKVTIVTPDIGEDAEEVLGLPHDFLNNVDIAVASYHGDIFQLLRRFLNLFSFSKDYSYTEQLKERIGGGGVRSRMIDKLLYIYQAIFAIPDTEWPWHNAALRVAEDLLVNQSFDAVLSSSPFPTVHRVAARLKKAHGLLWIADFRDPWSQSHNYQLPELRRRLDAWMEVRTLASADLITTVSWGVAEKLKRLHGDGRISVIRNGFQQIPYESLLPMPDRFTISYTGTIYRDKQDPEKILIAIRSLIDNGDIEVDAIRLNFYGRYDNNLQELISTTNLEDVVSQHGILSRAEIRLLQRTSHLLLLFLWEDPTEKGIFPLKFYEYLDSNRPIMATGRDGTGEISEILAETNTGVVAKSIPEIKSYLTKCYLEYKETGSIHYNGIQGEISKYSFDNSSKKLVEYIQCINK